MVLGFKDFFVKPILDGIKIHSIRSDSHDRWKAGKKIHFATGIRTPNYLQFKLDVCKGIEWITIINRDELIYLRIFDEKRFSYISGEYTYGRNLFYNLAYNDGLSGLAFKNWFVPRKNDKYTGKIIHWTDFRYTGTGVKKCAW